MSNFCTNKENILKLLFLHLIQREASRYCGFFTKITYKMIKMKLAKRGYSYSQIAKYTLL